MGMAGSKIMKR